ncbi:MAG: hypothetical protein COA69_09340 [Robiginitomaculum sp.]|nr:MAG: hypothetical protein COA69_09340 [Robiginitomaculum sp.]
MVVWVPRNDRLRDLSAAEEYGTICEAFPANLAPYDFPRMRRIFETDVLPIASRDDKIIVLGPTIMVAQFLMMWTLSFDQPNLIVFDRVPRRYRQVPRL